MTDGSCFYHFCEAASYRDNALYCGRKGQEVLDMKECPDGLWFKKADGWPVLRPQREKS